MTDQASVPQASQHSSVDVRHFPDAGVSLAVKVEEGIATMTACVVNLRAGDKFSRRTARRIVKMRLDNDNVSLHSFHLAQRTASFPYGGCKPRQDILFPLATRLSATLRIRKETNGKAGGEGSIGSAQSIFDALGAVAAMRTPPRR